MKIIRDINIILKMLNDNKNNVLENKILTVKTANTGRCLGDLFVSLLCLQTSSQVILITHEKHIEVCMFFKKNIKQLLLLSDDDLSKFDSQFRNVPLNYLYYYNLSEYNVIDITYHMLDFKKTAMRQDRYTHRLLSYHQNKVLRINNYENYSDLSNIIKLPKNSIIILPQRSDRNILDNNLTQNIVDYLLKENVNLNIYIRNNYTKLNDIENTTTLNCKIDELLYKVNGQNITLIGNRCGFMDLLYLTTDINIISLYPDTYLWDWRFSKIKESALQDVINNSNILSSNRNSKFYDILIENTTPEIINNFYKTTFNKENRETKLNARKQLWKRSFNYILYSHKQ